MKKKLFLVILGILLIIYVSILKFQGFNLQTLSSANLFYVLLALITLIVILGLRSLKYWMLLNRLKINPGKDTYLITNFGYFSNFISPIRISEVVRSLVIKKVTGNSFFKILAPTVFDSLTDVITIVFVILVLSTFVVLNFDYSSKILLILLFAAVAVTSIYLISTRKGEQFSIKILNYVAKRVLKKDVSRTSKEFVHASRVILGSRRLLFTVFLVECFVWVLEGLKIYWFGLAAGLNLGLPTSMLIVAVSYLIGGAFVNPSGLTQETILLLILTQLPFEKASLTLVGSMDAIISVGFVIAAGLIFTLKFGIKNLRLERLK